MRKWIIGLVLGLSSLVAFAGVASAHTAGVGGVASCDTTNGTQDVIYVVTTAAVPSPTLVGTFVLHSSNGIVEPSATFAGNGEFTVDVTGIPGNATTTTLTVSAKWTDGATWNSSDTIELSGDCSAPATTTTTVPPTTTTTAPPVTTTTLPPATTTTIVVPPLATVAPPAPPAAGCYTGCTPTISPPSFAFVPAAVPAPAAPAPSLAFTGAPIGELAGIGLLTLLSGCAIVYFARKRKVS